MGGPNGSGTLNITNGGTVSIWGTMVGAGAGCAGTINFGANGGTLTTAWLGASPAQLIGTGTINAGGLVSDIALLFNSTASLKQTIRWNGLPNQNVTVNLDMSTPANNDALGAGWTGTGSLTIQNGVTVSSNYGFLGYNPGSTGAAAVSGAGSTWASVGLFVGYSGHGTLNITNGGTVDGSCTVGENAGASGTVAVDGAGSTLSTGNGGLYVGYSGNGTLKITGSGAVTSGATATAPTSATTPARRVPSPLTARARRGQRPVRPSMSALPAPACSASAAARP